MRKLATIQKISELRPIPGADKICVALLEGLGWEIVIRKDEFKVGDTAIFIEVDSVVPDRPEFEFLRERKFKVKTIRLKKQVSQGLIVPLSVLHTLQSKFEIGLDVTEELGIKKYDPQLQEEQTLQSTKHRSKFMKFAMRFAPFRFVYMLLNSKEKGNFPSWISKTDEERIQNCATLLINNLDKPFDISEKCDGCLHESTLVETSSGVMSVKDICEGKKRVLVPSLNEVTGEIENRRVSGFSVKEDNGDWYKVSFGGSEVLLTGDHLVYLPELLCWREVRNLREGDRVLQKKS
jgi:hypothetical protein